MMKNRSKLNMGVLAFTIIAMFGVVIYFTFFNKDDIPDVTPPAPKVYVEQVELDKTELTINVGESSSLKVMISPTDATNKNYKWINNNESVVKIDANNNITGLSVGKATLTIKTEDGNKTASCVVKVVDPNSPVETSVDVVGITLNNTNLAMLKGTNYKLIVNINPNNATNKNVTWSSSDEKIASVDENGNVIAKEVGKVTITVRAKDGGKSAICHVTVMDKEIPVTGVIMSKTELTLVKGDSETLIAGLVPNNATNNKVTWSSSNNSVAKVDANGKVTGVNSGKAVITVTTKDGNKTAKCNVTVKDVRIEITDIVLSEKEITLPIGISKKLTAKVVPNNATVKDILWWSSDEKVATVDSNGTVKAIGLGKAIIKAEAIDGSKTSTCEVTVTRE